MADSKKQLFFIFAVVAGALCLYGAVRFLTEDEPARIRHAVYVSVLGLEKKDPSRYGAILSPQYQDEKGNNKFTLLKMVQGTLCDFESVKCDIQQLTVEMKEGLTAKVTIGFNFYFKNARDQKMYYDQGMIFADFFKEGRAWRVRNLDFIDAQDMVLAQDVN